MKSEVCIVKIVRLNEYEDINSLQLSFGLLRYGWLNSVNMGSHFNKMAFVIVCGMAIYSAEATQAESK